MPNSGAVGELLRHKRQNLSLGWLGDGGLQVFRHSVRHHHIPTPQICQNIIMNTPPYTHICCTYTRLMALFLGLAGWASTRKVKPIWILLKQEIVSSNGISWVICKSAPHYRQTTTPAPHHSVFYRPDALSAAQPTVSKHWRHKQRDSTEGKYARGSTSHSQYISGRFC